MKRETTPDGKYQVYPFGKWWHVREVSTSRVILKGNSRRDVLDKIEALND